MHKLAPVYTRNYGAPRERKRERERYIYILYHNITRAKQNKTGINVIQAYVHAGANPHELDPPRLLQRLASISDIFMPFDKP